MSAGEWIFYLLMLMLSLSTSAFCGGVETGAYTVNRLRLAIRADRGEPRAKLLLNELRFPNRWLATLLIGNTVTGYLSSEAIGHMLLRCGFSPLAGMALNAVILLPLLVVFGETLPKEIFRVHADSWTVASAPVARWMRWLFTAVGAVGLLNWLGNLLVRHFALAPSEVIDARLRVVELLRESRGVVDERQMAMAGRVLELSRRPASSLMTPWRRVAQLSEGALGQVIHETLRSRAQANYPVIDADGACVGVVNAIDLLSEPSASPAALAREAVSVPPSMPALEVLRHLRQAGMSLAIVSEGMRPVGVIGIRDILEPVVGRMASW